ncbi:MAG: serine--tRNA ligase [Bacteroidales bacterium]|nr:serine--tRNA ligase [Bacteroidales bacterium]MDZ4204263.1 serine--tRNA ligase [Bacteroidales bacterium]
MLELNLIRENPEFVKERLGIKNFEAGIILQHILELDKIRRDTKNKLDQCLAESKNISKEIGALLQAGKTLDVNVLKERTAELKVLTKTLDDAMRQAETQQNQLLIQLPNFPHPSVKPGKTAEDNEIVQSEGVIPVLAENAVPHWELCQRYNIIDFELGNKITGSGFPVYRGQGARLQRALINFFLDEGIKAGYLEYQPPLLVNEASGYGTGQLPDKDGQMYYINEDNLYLIPTAEVPVTNFYRDVILKESDLPIKNIAYSSCFRREAGSYGKDVRGLNRLHQFDKVEIVQIQHPEKSWAALEEMREHVVDLLQKLELPFRILRLCGGDMSFASAMTYDMEVYSAAQQRWLEVSSVSNFETFQSNRMKLRYKDTTGKIRLLHTLNGSALALPRIVAAMLENNQTEKGILIPAVLQPYTGFELIS